MYICIGMISRGTQTSPPLFRDDIASIAQSQKWTKETVEPFLKELRQSIFANKPEDLKEFIMAYCFNSIKKDPPPSTISRPDPDDPEDEDEDEDDLVVTGKKKKKSSKKKKKKGRNLDNDEDDDDKSISNKPTSNKVTNQNSIIKVHMETGHAGVGIGGGLGLNRGLSLGEGGMSNLSSGASSLSRIGSHFKLGGGGGGSEESVGHGIAAIPHLPDLGRLNRDM